MHNDERERDNLRAQERPIPLGAIILSKKKELSRFFASSRIAFVVNRVILAVWANHSRVGFGTSRLKRSGGLRGSSV